MKAIFIPGYGNNKILRFNESENGEFLTEGKIIIDSTGLSGPAGMTIL